MASVTTRMFTATADPQQDACMGQPNLSNPTACTPPPATGAPPYLPVFYQITVGGAGGPAGSFNLQETLPPTFAPGGASCTVGPPLNVLSTTAGVTIFGQLTLAAGQSAICFVTGYFTTPGASATNSVTVANAITVPAVPSPYPIQTVNTFAC